MEDFLVALSIGDLLIIEAVLDNETRQLKSEVLEIPNGNKLIISCPSYQGRLVNIVAGERYHMYHADPESGVYKFMGLIVQREKSELIYRLHVLRVSEVSRAQRRNHFRLSLVEPATLNIPDGEGEEVFFHQGQQIVQIVARFRTLDAILKDISAGGARVYSKESLEIGTRLLMDVNLEGQKFRFECEIVRCFLAEDVVKRYDLGIKFLNIDSQLQRKLVGVIFDKQRKMLKKGLSS